MFDEAFTKPLPDIIRELQDMGVEQTLISHAEADPRLLAGLYIYVLVEAINADDEIVEVQELLAADPWRQTTQSYRHTHVSVEDDSPAMLVRQNDGTITLMNEDGYVWTDPLVEWRPWRQTTQSCRKCNYLAEGKFDGALSLSHTCGIKETWDDYTDCGNHPPADVCPGYEGDENDPDVPDSCKNR